MITALEAFVKNI